MNPQLVVITSLLYLLLLFYIAAKAKNWRVVTQPKYQALVYALSMGVYCTAWTYYGSVGKASRDGIDFLAVYIGPTLVAPLWWILLRKMIRISQVHRITTIADFISSRYGKNISLGMIITLFCLIGIVPYIALQLKAISESFDIITNNHFTSSHSGLFGDSGIVVLIIMAVFTILFGARRIETDERHEGMMSAIAFESIIKLLAFLAVGIFITFYIFNGFGDLFTQAINSEGTSDLTIIPEKQGYRDWFWITILSGLAVMLLPRQFQVAVVENKNENHIKTAMWVFPMYLFLINLFVLPVAIGGLLLNTSESNPDYFLLQLPMQWDAQWLSLIVFIGGVSAATGMIIVETMALSTMFSNNLIIPSIVGNERLKHIFSKNVTGITLWMRRFAIVLILSIAFVYYKMLDQYYSLVSIGLISFVSVAQFAPALIGGMFWKKATKTGALSSIIVGFVIWFYTLVIPSIFSHTAFGAALIENGLFGIEILKPSSLFGLEDFSPISHAMFWSMFFNIVTYIVVSFYTNQTVIEKNQSEVFVDIFKYSAVYESTVVLKGKASLPDIENTLSNFFGRERSHQVIRLFAKKHDIDITDPGQMADSRIITYAERLLAGVIGSASARMMMSSIVSEEEIRINEVVNILKESQQILSSNRELTRKSEALRNALDELATMNDRLKENDQLKDDFLSTVTHELRTPITSIRAFSEILYDNPELDETDRQHYLGIVIKETERMSRLISQVLDLERYESGKQKISLNRLKLNTLVTDAIEAVDGLLKEKEVKIEISMAESEIEIYCDRDKMMQVLLNILSNAIKFIDNKTGLIKIETYQKQDNLFIQIQDNGKGIEKEYQELIFEKFFQEKNQLIRKPKGTGLGLAISKKIMDLHHGKIEVKSEIGSGSIFTIQLPYNLDQIILREQSNKQGE